MLNTYQTSKNTIKKEKKTFVNLTRVKFLMSVCVQVMCASGLYQYSSKQSGRVGPAPLSHTCLFVRFQTLCGVPSDWPQTKACLTNTCSLTKLDRGSAIKILQKTLRHFSHCVSSKPKHYAFLSALPKERRVISKQ